jgi:hypothetical protein
LGLADVWSTLCVVEEDEEMKMKFLLSGHGIFKYYDEVFAWKY